MPAKSEPLYSMHNEPPYSFVLIAPYGKLAASFVGIAAGWPCTLRVWENVTLDEAAAIAEQAVAETETEVIFSRGGTADYIRSSVDVPVVSVSFTPLDLLRTLQPFAGVISRAAFFTYREPMPEVRTIASLLNMTIDEYLFHSRDDIFGKMLEAKAKGAQIGVGGILVAKMRELCGLDGILLEAGEDSVSRALHEAFAVAKVRREEQHRRARILTILNNVAEGILVTDENNDLTLINPTAERLLGVAAAEVQGRDARAVVPHTRTAEVLRSGVPELNEVQEINGNTIITSRVPITAVGRTVGVVCTFSGADRIHQADNKLRRQMQAKGFRARRRLNDVHTDDALMRELISLARVFASTEATILLQGESGTGKELFAQGIHLAGKRSDQPFVAVNCAAVPESLLESELFGYEEGAFTGAKRRGKAGFFELAHKGTLFLDEIGELPRPLQGRLLRVLEEGEIVRVGGEQVISVDVRIICATNRDLGLWTSDGHFRQDLYYRLNVLPLTIPPLRERKGDVMLLAELFLRRRMTDPDRLDTEVFEAQVGDMLRGHNWPGNVRELRNVAERLALAAAMFPDRSWRELLRQVWGAIPSAPAEGKDGCISVPCAGSLKEMTRRMEQAAIRRLLTEHAGDQQRVAALLGISRMSVWRKLQQ
jgi:propionate catabolism regulator PrpR